MQIFSVMPLNFPASRFIQLGIDSEDNSQIKESIS